MKKAKLYAVVLLGAMFFLGNLGLSSVYAAQEEKPEPLALNNTIWGIQLTHTAADGKKTISTDKLIFEDDKFNSEGFKDKDYVDSNYTLSALEDGATVFETMQTKDDGKVFWRGEIRGKGIRGIISVHPDKGAPKDYSFVGGLNKGELGETNKEKKAREKAEKEAKKAAEEAAKAAVERAARAVELAAQRAEQAAAETNTTTTEEPQSIGDKLKGILDKIKGQAPEQQSELPEPPDQP